MNSKQKLIYIICGFLLWSCGNHGNSELKVSDIEDITTTNRISEQDKANVVN
jgi:hypothetical protein